LNFPAAAVGVEEKEILGSYSAAVDRQEESRGWFFRETLPVAGLILIGFRWKRSSRPCLWLHGPWEVSLKV